MMFLNICLGQEIVFKASVSSNTVDVTSPFQIVYSADNVSGVSNFAPPDFGNFVVLGGPNRSSSFSNINGSASSRISYSYVLQGKKIGKFNIAGASATIEGKTCKSNSISITVVKAGTNTPRYKNAAPGEADGMDAQNPFSNNPFGASRSKAKREPYKNISPQEMAKKVFARVDLDKQEAYVGEQIIASYNIYAQIPCAVDAKKIVTPEGFWSHDFTDADNPQEAEKVVIDGQPYRKFTLRKTALFPSRAGKLWIPPMEFGGYAQVETSPSIRGPSNGFIEEIFSDIIEEAIISRVPLELKTDSVSVSAVALPDKNKPASFNNNVGTYTIEANINKAELGINDVATITYTIRGKGIIPLLNAPVWAPNDNYSVMQPLVFDTLTNNKNDVEGYKVFKYSIEPNKAGNISIPSAEFSYFDPALKTYKTLQTPSYTLAVSDKTIKAKSTNTKKQLHDILNEDNMAKIIPHSIMEQPVYWLAFILPFLGYGFLRYRKKRKEQVQITQSNNLFKKISATEAMERLNAANAMLEKNNVDAFYNKTSEALWLYASSKWQIPIADLNTQKVKMALQLAQIPSPLQDRFFALTNTCQEAIYAQSAGSEFATIQQEAKSIIEELESQFEAQ